MNQTAPLDCNKYYTLNIDWKINRKLKVKTSSVTLYNIALFINFFDLCLMYNIYL